MERQISSPFLFHEYNNYLVPCSKINPNLESNHWIEYLNLARYPILGVLANRLAYFILHQFSVYPNPAYLLEKFRRHDFWLMNDRQEVQAARDIFARFQACKGLNQYALKSINDELDIAEQRINKKEGPIENPISEDEDENLTGDPLPLKQGDNPGDNVLEPKEPDPSLPCSSNIVDENKDIVPPDNAVSVLGTIPDKDEILKEQPEQTFVEKGIEDNVVLVSNTAVPATGEISKEQPSEIVENDNLSTTERVVDDFSDLDVLDENCLNPDEILTPIKSPPVEKEIIKIDVPIPGKWAVKRRQRRAARLAKKAEAAKIANESKDAKDLKQLGQVAIFVAKKGEGQTSDLDQIAKAVSDVETLLPDSLGEVKEKIVEADTTLIGDAPVVSDVPEIQEALKEEPETKDKTHSDAGLAQLSPAVNQSDLVTNPIEEENPKILEKMPPSQDENEPICAIQ